MKTAITIIEDIILPKLEKDSKFSEVKLDTAFWKKLSNAILHFEADAKPLYVSFYSLELDNPEKIIAQLPNIYNQFVKELAENYVLGHTSEATDYLTKSHNDIFTQEIAFLKSMQRAITNVERKHIKAELPTSFERLTFELSETNLSNVTKKIGREDLKEKMKKWDGELEEENTADLALLTNDKKGTKVISLTWVKYAAAACVIISIGLFYFKNSDTDVIHPNNTVVVKEKIEDKAQPQIKSSDGVAIVIDPIDITTKTTTVLQSESLGYTTDKKLKIKILFNDANQRIAALEKFIEINQKNNSQVASKYKIELSTLKTQQGKYLFDGQILTFFSKKSKAAYEVLQTEDEEFFLKNGDTFYRLKIISNPSDIEKVTNTAIIETLEKIHFENQ